MASELLAQISNGPSPAIKVVALVGEMDESNLDALRAQLEGILNDPSVQTVIFHMKDLAFINSKGIGYLVSVHTHLAKDKRKLVLAEAQEAVLDVVNLIGLTSIIPYHETLEAVLQSG